MGFHTGGEMGGIWTAPIKLLDGIWFGVNGQWIGPAASFTSGFGYVHMALPSAGGVQLSRTDFAPDGRRAVEIGPRLRPGHLHRAHPAGLHAEHRRDGGRPGQLRPARPGLLEVLPDVPDGQSSVSGTNIRVGTGAVDVAATHHGSSYTTTVTASLACTLHVGATVPAGAAVHQVTLNGSAAHYAVRDTNAGREVMVSNPCRGQTWHVHVVAG